MTNFSSRGSLLLGFAKLRFHPLFEALVVTIIIFSALIAGFKTFPFTSQYQEIFNTLDYVITAIFLFELLIRLLSEKRAKDFFKNGWNIFDTAIVIISLVPINNADLVVVGRMLRIFRIMRVVSFIPELIHSSSIYSMPGFPLIGKSSFGIMLLNGSNLVPNPANGIIACLIIAFFYI